MHQARNTHTPLPLFPRMVEWNGALPLPVLPAVLKLKVDKCLKVLVGFKRVFSFLKCTVKSYICKQTFLKIFMPMSDARSGTAGLLRLVTDTLEKVSELRDLPSSLHFKVMS